jgi:hypothetical protein
MDEEQLRRLTELLLDGSNGLPPPGLAADPVGTCDACAGSVMSISRKSPSRFTSRPPLGDSRDQSSGPVDRAERSKDTVEHDLVLAHRSGIVIGLVQAT